LRQFCPFLTAGTFAGNEKPYPMTNLDSMLVHSMAYMLYVDEDVQEKNKAWDIAIGMPKKYLGEEAAKKAFTDKIRTDKLDAKMFFKADGRKYVPAIFNISTKNESIEMGKNKGNEEKDSKGGNSWVHGQNFIIVRQTANAICVDTNWIESGRPIYWEISTKTSTSFDLNQYFFNGQVKSSIQQKSFQHGQIYIMPKK
jgi:hypothetical protein